MSIHIKKSTRGSLRKITHTPKGKKIPLKKIKKLEHSSSKKVRKKAQFADNARKWKHK